MIQITRDKSAKILQDTISKFSFIDLWLNLNHQKNGNTGDGQNVPKSRIDYVFFTDNFCHKPLNFFLRKPPNVSKSRLSDHPALVFKCEISGNTRGKGFWKLNTSILKESAYCDLINNFSADLPEIRNNSNCKTKWELIKFKIKKLSIDYCKNRNKTQREKIQKIENEIEQMEKRHFLQK